MVAGKKERGSVNFIILLLMLVGKP
jgi:hypothetical protein